MSVALHAAEAGPVPVEALEWFRGKGLRPGFSHEDVWREEHAFAFTAAKVMREDVLEAMRDELAHALEEGHTFEQFRKTIEERLVALGWWGKQPVHDPVTGRVVEVNVPSRIARIFETNMRTARAAGQWQRIERTKRTHPFLVYLNGPSREHRPEHVEWAGTALPVDDPWWDTHFPPNGWGCKCWVRQVSERTLERLRETGIRGSDGTVIPIRETAPAIRLVSYINKRTGATHEAPEGIDPGWEYNVGKVRQGADGSKPPDAPAMRRRGQLKALGFSEEVVQRDLLEQPPPPEPTREGAVEWAKGLRPIASILGRGEALDASEGQHLRQQVRRLMRAHAPDLFSRDIEHRPGRYSVRIEGALPADAGGLHLDDGSMLLDADVAARLGRALREMARGRAPKLQLRHALATMIHEELHGHSPIAGDPMAYAANRALEETTVEALSRVLIGRLHSSLTSAPIDAALALPRVRSTARGAARLVARVSHGGAYQPAVEALWLAVAQATGLREDELTTRIVNALASTHFGPLPMTSSERLLDRLAHALAPEVPERMRRALLARMLDVEDAMHETRPATPGELFRAARYDDIEAAKRCVAAFVERDGNCSSEVIGMLAKSQPDVIEAIRVLDDYRRELSGKPKASGVPYR